jgi:hypothetical protein
MQLMAERSHMDVFIDQLRSDAFAFAGLGNLLTLPSALINSAVAKLRLV